VKCVVPDKNRGSSGSGSRKGKKPVKFWIRFWREGGKDEEVLDHVLDKKEPFS
jgi:hypothetical protein